MLTATDLQRQTLRLYGELLCRRHTYGGELVLVVGPGSAGTGLPAAVSIAGGTMLAIDPDAAQVKAILRAGGLDFVVNTLDEALRVLKNEIRQKRPLSVGLITPLQSALEEMVDRGVLPRLEISLTPLEAHDEEIEHALQSLANTGMERLAIGLQDGVAQPSPELSAWLADLGWLETELTVASLIELRELDHALLETLPQTGGPRRLWLQRIGHYQRPLAAAGRAIWLSLSERLLRNRP